MISEDSYIPLFGRFPFWVPTRFPEAICPRYGPVRTIKIFFRKIQRIRKPSIRTFTRRQGFHSSGKEKQEISF